MSTNHKRRPKLEAFALRALVGRRRALIETRTHADEQARLLYEERETDWEDRAANVAAATDLERLGDTERAELARITNALDRLDQGTWGACTGCGKAIDERRLRALPEALDCLDCASPQRAAATTR